MEDNLLKKVKEKLNWREKIILCIWEKLYLKVYNITRMEIINSFLNN